jgi:signal transduction histidine kinase
MTIRFDKFSVLNIINEAAGLISPLLAKTGNSLVIKDVDELLYAYGDVQKLRQVLINLLSNANKFTDEGSITISAGLELEYVTITVSDTGIGIEPNFIQHLFQPFSQVENDLNRQFQGTGLGLVISKKFIELMNGKIEVESVFGQGSSFKVLIPSQSPFGLIKAAYEENIGR